MPVLVSIFFTGVVGIENLGDVFGDAVPLSMNWRVTCSSSARARIFKVPPLGIAHGIFYQIRKDLFDLPAVSEDFRILPSINLHLNLRDEARLLVHEDFFDQFTSTRVVQFRTIGVASVRW